MTAFGVLDAFLAHAQRAPDALALAIASPGDVAVRASMTFGELHDRAARFAGGLRDAGLRPGDRVVLALPAGADFYALALGLIGSGMTVVLIDGSLDRRRLLGALRSARASAIVGGASAMRRWPLVPPLLRMRRYAVGRAPWGVRPLEALATGRRAATLVGSTQDAAAIISFTSGSSGRAKGVSRTRDVLLAQHRLLAAHLPFRPGDVDMPGFPAMVLHNLCCGVATVLPPIDLRRPATADPAAVAALARRAGVTTLSGAPAYVGLLVDHLAATGESLPAIRRVVVGGAPVPRTLCRRIVQAFPNADCRVVYGATEAEPVAHVGMRDVLAAGPAEGLLVGAPVHEVDVALVSLPERIDGPLAAAALVGGGAGEVVVAGPNVSGEYVGDPEANAANKVREAPGGRIWHRTGDIARLDDEGRLWLLGRRGEQIAHRGRRLHPVSLEADLHELPGLRGAGLVAHSGAPGGELAIVADSPTVLAEVRRHLRERGLESLPVRRLAEIPMDRRHNSKVDRGALARLLAA